MERSTEAAVGAVCAAAAFVFWGLTPIFWKLIDDVPSRELLAHRVLWCGVLLAPALLSRRLRGAFRRILTGRGTLLPLAGSTVLIAVNWYLYIFAVNHGRILEASLGYYMNPLVNVLLGTAILHERLGRRKQLAVAVAAVGVAVLTVHVGRFPWIALGLAFSFGVYGFLRKRVAASALEGVAVETWLLSPLAIGFLVLTASRGSAAFPRADLFTSVLLVATGLVTALPLILFGLGARRLQYSTIGILQYIAPTLQFLLAVAVYHEPFDGVRFVAFLLIWTAVALYSVDAIAGWRRERRELSEVARNDSPSS